MRVSIILKMVCVVATAAALVAATTARADWTGDPDFCYGGWKVIKSAGLGETWFCRTATFGEPASQIPDER